MSFFWLFLVFAFVGIVPGVVTGNFLGDDFSKILFISGVFCAFALLFWVCYVFFPYAIWALRQENNSEWNGFFDPPIDLRQAKCARRLFLFDKIGIWIMCGLGGLAYLGSLLSRCYECKSYQPIVSGFVYPLIFFSFIFAVCCVIYWIVRFVKNFNVICSCICCFFSKIRKNFKSCSLNENYFKTCILIFCFIISVCMILITLKVCL